MGTRRLCSGMPNHLIALRSRTDGRPETNFQWRDVDEGWSFLVFASYADRWPQSGNGRRYEE